MAYQLHCPCGEQIRALDDDFLPQVQSHLAAEHPGRDYSENEIMFMATKIADKFVKPKAE